MAGRIITLENDHLQFSLHPDSNSWSLYGRKPDSPFLENITLCIVYKVGKSLYEYEIPFSPAKINDKVVIVSKHGSEERFQVFSRPNRHGLQAMVAFGLPTSTPLLIWNVALMNRGSHTVEIDRIELLRAGELNPRKRSPRRRSDSRASVIRPHPNPGELRFYSNGWQSWSYTGTYGRKDRTIKSRLGTAGNPMWYNPDTPSPSDPGHFGSDFFAVIGDRKNRTGILAGFLSQHQHFGSLETRLDPYSPALRMWANGDTAQLKPKAQIKTDLAAIQFVNLDDPDPLDAYLQAVNRENEVHPHVGILPDPYAFSGWCSWYHFFQDVTAEVVAHNLSMVKHLDDRFPLDLIQIDDGFEAQVGDWLAFDRSFPDGVAPLAEKIRTANYIPGLWLAPFIVHSKSRFYKDHPNLVIHDERGRPVKAGYVWNNQNLGLDLTQKASMDYVGEVIDTAVHKWGYPYLKLDFLYAAALKGRHANPTLTRAQVLRRGLEVIRKTAGEDTYLLACGCPLGPAVGLFDAMRIGADVAPDWRPNFKGIQVFFRKEPSMPAVINSVQNPLTRAFMHQEWWANDADCLLLRPESNLSLTEVQTLATLIALTGGPLLFSDDLSKLPEERVELGRSLLPLIGKTPRVVDWFDKQKPSMLRIDLHNLTGVWHLLAKFNWEDHPITPDLSTADYHLEGADFFSRDFWNRKVYQMRFGGFSDHTILPHGVHLLAVRPFDGDQPVYIGSDLHISQGLEVTDWWAEPEKVSLTLQRPGKSTGRIELYLPFEPKTVKQDGIPKMIESLSQNIYRLSVSMDTEARITIQ